MSSDSEIEIEDLNAFQQARFKVSGKSTLLRKSPTKLPDKKTRRVVIEELDSLDEPKFIANLTSQTGIEEVFPTESAKQATGAGKLALRAKSDPVEILSEHPIDLPQQSIHDIASLNPSRYSNNIPVLDSGPTLNVLPLSQDALSPEEHEETSSDIELNVPLSSHNLGNDAAVLSPTTGEKRRVRFAVDDYDEPKRIGKVENEVNNEYDNQIVGEISKNSHLNPTVKLAHFAEKQRNLNFLHDLPKIFEHSAEEIIVTRSVTKDEEIRLESLGKYVTNLNRKINELRKYLKSLEDTEVPAKLDIKADKYWLVCVKEADIKVLTLRKSQLRDSIKQLNIEYNKHAHLAHQNAIKNKRILDLRKHIFEATQILKEVELQEPYYEELKSQLTLLNEDLLREQSQFDIIEQETQATDMQIVRHSRDKYRACLQAIVAKDKLRADFISKCRDYDAKITFHSSKADNGSGYAAVLVKYMTILVNLDTGSRTFHFSYPVYVEPVYSIYASLMHDNNLRVSKCLRLWQRANEIQKLLGSLFPLGPYEFITDTETKTTKFVQHNIITDKRLCIILKGETIMGEMESNMLDLPQLREIVDQNIACS